MELCVISTKMLDILQDIVDFRLLNLDQDMEIELWHVRFTNIWVTQQDLVD